MPDKKFTKTFFFLHNKTYYDMRNEVMVVKFKLMQVKYQINTNTKKNVFSFPTKYEERV